MTFTYNPNLTSDVHKVRFRLMDTDEAKAKLDDNEITAMLTQVGGAGWASALRAAARCARSLHVRYGLVASMSAIGASVAYKDKSYLELADELEQEAAGSSSAAVALPFIGGISRAQKDVQTADTDRVRPWAEIGVHDNPDAGESVPSLTQSGL